MTQQAALLMPIKSATPWQWTVAALLNHCEKHLPADRPVSSLELLAA